MIGSYPLLQFTNFALYLAIYSVQFVSRLLIILRYITYIISFTIHRDKSVLRLTRTTAYLLLCVSSSSQTLK